MNSTSGWTHGQVGYCKHERKHPWRTMGTDIPSVEPRAPCWLTSPVRYIGETNGGHRRSRELRRPDGGVRHAHAGACLRADPRAAPLPRPRQVWPAVPSDTATIMKYLRHGSGTSVKGRAAARALHGQRRAWAGKGTGFPRRTNCAHDAPVGHPSKCQLHRLPAAPARSSSTSLPSACSACPSEEIRCGTGTERRTTPAAATPTRELSCASAAPVSPPCASCATRTMTKPATRATLWQQMAEMGWASIIAAGAATAASDFGFLGRGRRPARKSGRTLTASPLLSAPPCLGASAVLLERQ